MPTSLERLSLQVQYELSGFLDPGLEASKQYVHSIRGRILAEWDVAWEAFKRREISIMGESSVLK